MAKNRIHIELKGFDEALKELEYIDRELREKTMAKALRKAARPVIKRAKALCPRSKRTGSTDRLSSKSKSGRGEAKPLAETIGYVIRKRGSASKTLAVIGPQYPAGAHGHLVEYGHDKVLWGNRVGGRVPPKPFLRPAADETKSEQERLIVETVKAEVKRILSIPAVRG